MKLSILIPVFNEEVLIAELLRRVAAVDLEKEIILVDDCSTDASWSIINGLNIDELHVYQHPENLGKGAGIRTALAQATGDVVMIQDADLEYDPRDYPKLVEPLMRGEADVVYGARNLGDQKPLMRLGNQFLTLATNLLYGSRLTDMETCYKVVPTELMRRLDLQADRFQIEPEITAKLLLRKCRIVEVPISYEPREEKKLSPWRDGLPALMTLLKLRFSNR
jgi:glycosyltransferase involved in cell wall biosynthesis